MSENQNGCSPSDCQGCAHAGTCNSKPQDFHKPANAKSHIRNVIAVVSGKGGVGKSMVTASLARMMREQGFSVGILDVSTMWGFSILLGAVAAFFLHASVPVVYILLMSDELVKLPLTLKRYRSYKWLKDVTRNNLEI